MLETEKVSELMDLAIKVQRETEYGVFVNFHGHVESLDVIITESKDDYHSKIYEWSFYIDEESDYAFNKGNYKVVKETLETILNK
jgi:hypothetical protein